MLLGTNDERRLLEIAGLMPILMMVVGPASADAAVLAVCGWRAIPQRPTLRFMVVRWFSTSTVFRGCAADQDDIHLISARRALYVFRSSCLWIISYYLSYAA